MSGTSSIQASTPPPSQDKFFPMRKSTPTYHIDQCQLHSNLISRISTSMSSTQSEASLFVMEALSTSIPVLSQVGGLQLLSTSSTCLSTNTIEETTTTLSLTCRTRSSLPTSLSTRMLQRLQVLTPFLSKMIHTLLAAADGSSLLNHEIPLWHHTNYNLHTNCYITLT